MKFFYSYINYELVITWRATWLYLNRQETSYTTEKATVEGDFLKSADIFYGTMYCF